MLLFVDGLKLVSAFPSHSSILLSTLNLSFSFFKNANFKLFLCPLSQGLKIHFYKFEFSDLNRLD